MHSSKGAVDAHRMTVRGDLNDSNNRILEDRSVLLFSAHELSLQAIQIVERLV